MSYPTLEEYTQALQSPAYAFFDPELKSGSVKKSGLGIPLALCGGFALTYKVTCSSNVYAVRCFHKESKNLEMRYDAISRKLNSLRSSYFVDFHFIGNGVKASGKVAPIVKMKWSEGETLGDFVYENYSNKTRISTLHRELIKLNEYLELNNIAHGDIQPGNIMINSLGSNIKLIDYDGMYVDELRNIHSSESGLRNFQHPLRSNQWNVKLDRFSFILLDLVFDLLELNPSLWIETKSHPEMFIFSANDFADPLHSPIIQKIKGCSSLSKKITNFISICRCRFDDIPTLKQFISGNIPNLGSSSTSDILISNKYINSFPVLDASDFNKCKSFVGQKVELIGRVYGIRRAKTVNGEDYVFVNFNDWRGMAVKLNIWSDGLVFVSDVINRLHTHDWLSVNGLIDAPFSKEYFDNKTHMKKCYTHISITINHPSQITLISRECAIFRLNNYKYADPGQSSLDNKTVYKSDFKITSQNFNINNNSVLDNIRGCTNSHPPYSLANTGDMGKNVHNTMPPKKELNNKIILENIHNISNNTHASSPSSQSTFPTLSSSPSDKKEDKPGGCFITSAVCTALDKPDDCLELNAFRIFRNKAKESSRQISSLIDEYYRIAPLIVSCIENEETGLEIYKLIWDNHISNIYQFLRNGDYYSVILGYIDLTVGLCDHYGVELSHETEEILESLSYSKCT